MRYILGLGFLYLFYICSVEAIFNEDLIVESARKLNLNAEKSEGNIEVTLDMVMDLEEHIRNISSDHEFLVFQVLKSESASQDQRWEKYKTEVKEKCKMKFPDMKVTFDDENHIESLIHPEGKFYPVKFSSIRVSDKMDDKTLEFVRSEWKSILQCAFDVSFYLDKMPVKCKSIDFGQKNLDSVELINNAKFPVVLSHSPSRKFVLKEVDKEKFLPETIFESSDRSIVAGFEWPVWKIKSLLTLVYDSTVLN